MNSFSVGDKVKVKDTKEARELTSDRWGWHSVMDDFINRVGTVSEELISGQCYVDFGEGLFAYHPDSLEKVYEHDSILNKAQKVIKQRGTQLGNSKQLYKQIAEIWSTIAEKNITPEKVILMMISLKICRQLQSHKLDNIVDIAGYAEVLGNMIGAE